MSKAERFSSMDDLLIAHPTALECEYGPIHKVPGVIIESYLKIEDKFYVQIYVGQHEWIAINADDISERYNDPGWQGTEYGYGYVTYDRAHFWPTSSVLEVGPPEREGKCLTEDAILFMDKDKLVEYLGPDDSVTKSFRK